MQNESKQKKKHDAFIYKYSLHDIQLIFGKSFCIKIKMNYPTFTIVILKNERLSSQRSDLT